MDENSSNNSGNSPQPSEAFGNVPNHSESYGSVPNVSEDFRTVRNHSERKESHSLTVREAARMFETAGVSRTERSIVNWCQPNKMGIARLDCYFDPNERKYFITPQSVQLAISEEQAKGSRVEAPAVASEPVGSVPKSQEQPLQAKSRESTEADPDEVKALKQEMMDLKITNRAKDMFIEQLKDERASFNQERQAYIKELMGFNRRVGELETKLLRLEATNDLTSKDSPKVSDQSSGESYGTGSPQTEDENPEPTLRPASF